MRRATADGFWKRVDRSAGQDACWPWIGSKTADGYGRLSWQKKGILAHRCAYRLTNGDVPPGMVVRHRCDNRPCCNPEHLEVGTPADNNRDAVERGRNAFGERSGAARLTSDQIFAIRVLFAAGEATRYQLAERFRVTHRQICYIVRNERWKRGLAAGG